MTVARTSAGKASKIAATTDRKETLWSRFVRRIGKGRRFAHCDYAPVAWTAFSGAPASPPYAR